MNDTPNPYDAGNRRHVERRDKSRKAQQRRLDEAFKWLMADPRGRLLLWQRLADAGVFQSSMAATPELTAFREGRRDMGLADLARLMRLCPEQYVRMTAESQADRPTNPGVNDDDARDED